VHPERPQHVQRGAGCAGGVRAGDRADGVNRDRREGAGADEGVVGVGLEQDRAGVGPQ
jgi:hypothetical protein